MRFGLMIVAALVSLPLLGFAQEAERRLTVTGEGRIEAVPDMATISLGVTAEARTAGEAIRANSRAMDAVLERLRAAGIEDRDLQTSNFSVHPRWERANSSNAAPRIAGFVAQNMLTVRVRDLSVLGETLDAVAQDGANSFSGLSFGLQDPEPVRDQARVAAVAEARRKAALLAEAAGVTLGPLLSIDEADGGGRPPIMMEMAEARMSSADAVPVAAGELSMTARIRLVYAIGE
ncbi:SIMPL domain-containing protein [Ovoidimarina sediminis]|uniref:SIMPL domain-containing protein n=1 Tax=Ovoidimarina sediminis TaxID=3079856 RepID=UPI00290B33FB|nr:SIMPL domain-containing protein [Rhodophyticola sp. MJ-SS7]MDU8943080.1 SIMPL domain-containing protein [Rhodophyticola sp. MJ-SS7]